MHTRARSMHNGTPRKTKGRGWKGPNSQKQNPRNHRSIALSSCSTALLRATDTEPAKAAAWRQCQRTKPFNRQGRTIRVDNPEPKSAASACHRTGTIAKERQQPPSSRLHTNEQTADKLVIKTGGHYDAMLLLGPRVIIISKLHTHALGSLLSAGVSAKFTILKDGLE